MDSISAIASAAATETRAVKLRSLSQNLRGAQASLTIISAEEALATATDQGIKAQATQAIYDASLNLQALTYDENLYKIDLDRAGNIIYFIVFTICFFYTIGMLFRSRYHWFNVTFFCGELLQFLGWLGRVTSFNDTSKLSLYLMQYIGLTLSPAFLMAGIYFLFAQLVVIHGREYSVLKPMWYSYFFITSDVLSLFIQAGGGGAALTASANGTSGKAGTDVMIAGIVFQVVAMSIFLVFWFEFLNRIYFKHLKSIALSLLKPSPYAKRSFMNYMKFLFNAKLIREYRALTLESHYNPRFQDIRLRLLFPWYPLAISIAVVLIYIRCVYRIVELAQGFSGYLIRHEVYLMVLDAFMIAVACLIFIPFHPVWVLGSENKVKLAHIKKNDDEKLLEGSLLDADDSPVTVSTEVK